MTHAETNITILPAVSVRLLLHMKPLSTLFEHGLRKEDE